MASVTFGDITGIQLRSFPVSMTFDVAVTDVTEEDIGLQSYTGQGITGVNLAISGAGTDYALAVTLPVNAAGSFNIFFASTVIPDGSATPEGVMGNDVTVFYDTRTSLAVTFGTVSVMENVYSFSLSTPDTIIIPEQTILQLSHVSGDAIDGIDYNIIGTSSDGHTAQIFIPINRFGTIEVNAVGSVYSLTQAKHVPVTGTAFQMMYNTYRIAIGEFDLPIAIPGEIYDAKFPFNAVVEGIHQNNAQIIIHEIGREFGSATAYKWVGTGEPDLAVDIRGTDPPPASDWAPLQSPPGGHQGAWYGEALQYLLMRYANVGMDFTGQPFKRYLNTLTEPIRNRGS